MDSCRQVGGELLGMLKKQLHGSQRCSSLFLCAGQGDAGGKLLCRVSLRSILSRSLSVSQMQGCRGRDGLCANDEIADGGRGARVLV